MTDHITPCDISATYLQVSLPILWGYLVFLCNYFFCSHHILHENNAQNCSCYQLHSSARSPPRRGPSLCVLLLLGILKNERTLGFCHLITSLQKVGFEQAHVNNSACYKLPKYYAFQVPTWRNGPLSLVSSFRVCGSLSSRHQFHISSFDSWNKSNKEWTKNLHVCHSFLSLDRCRSFQLTCWECVHSSHGRPKLLDQCLPSMLDRRNILDNL